MQVVQAAEFGLVKPSTSWESKGRQQENGIGIDVTEVEATGTDKATGTAKIGVAHGSVAVMPVTVMAGSEAGTLVVQQKLVFLAA